MLYEELLKNTTSCPFCSPDPKRILLKENRAFLTYAIAPYHKHHLLVVPDRHIEDFIEIDEVETRSIEKLLHKGTSALRSLGYENYTILVRNGDKSNKSIPHLHYHIIPTVIIGDLDHKNEKRIVLDDREIQVLLMDFDNMRGASV